MNAGLHSPNEHVEVIRLQGSSRSVEVRCKAISLFVARSPKLTEACNALDQEIDPLTWRSTMLTSRRACLTQARQTYCNRTATGLV
jgi:hypothetical protein